MLFFHSILCSPRTIFGYWKDLLSVTSKAFVFSGTIFRSLLSNQCFARQRLSLILSSRIPTLSAAHTTSASSEKPMMLVPAGRSMRRKSSYMMLQKSGPTRDPWGAPHVISSLRDHLSPSYITHLFYQASSRGLLPFLRRTNLCFFESAKNLPSRRKGFPKDLRVCPDHLFEDLV